MFDSSYNAVIIDFGGAVFMPGSTVLQQQRSLTGVRHSPTDARMWRVGTEAYAPPEAWGELRACGAGYDPTKYDVWSLGVILFLMFCIDSLEILVLTDAGGGQRCTLRMPFQARVSGFRLFLGFGFRF